MAETSSRRAVLDEEIGITRPTNPERAQARAARTVHVACKLPSGLTLKTWTMGRTNESYNGGHRQVDVAKQDPRIFEVKGNALPAGHTRAYIVPGNYAVTSGCPHDLWHKWLDQNGDTLLVENELIYAHEDHDEVLRWCAKRRAVRSGFEPVDPRKPHLVDPRARFRIQPGTTDNDDVERAALTEA